MIQGPFSGCIHYKGKFSCWNRPGSIRFSLLKGVCKDLRGSCQCNRTPSEIGSIKIFSLVWASCKKTLRDKSGHQLPLDILGANPPCLWQIAWDFVSVFPEENRTMRSALSNHSFIHNKILTVHVGRMWVSKYPLFFCTVHGK